MKTLSKMVAMAFVASFIGCSDDGGAYSVPDAFMPPLSDAAAVDVPPAVAFQTGRWTSRDGFEDPFEADLRYEGGIFSGRVCGPSMSTRSGFDRANCVSIEDAWIRGRNVHFSYVLPYTDLDRTPRAFDVVGFLNDEGNQISGVLRFNDIDSKSVHWLYCPLPNTLCAPPQ